LKKIFKKKSQTMDKHHITIGSFICLICFFALLWGCDKPQEPPQQTQKVTQKIAVAKTAESKAPAQLQKSDTQELDLKEKKGVGAEAGGEEKMPEPAVLTKAPTRGSLALSDLYDPQGKLDPFEPLFQPKPIALAAKKQKRRSAPPTPLEKVSLSQLKLVAIIRTPNENKALVQETTGKGYIVKTGTYIGLNAGKIVQILKDRIVIEEEVEDVYGKTTISKKSLQLQKSPGE
jgi:type IV pilus assembly protein PilP